MNALIPVGAFSGILLGAILIYWPVIANQQPDLIPWGSDSLGHISRTNFLGESIARGTTSPSIYPSWYLGMQLFRYYPPLTYHVLLVIGAITRHAVLAVNWLIFLSALLGGFSLLLYKKWVGWPAAMLGGLAYLILPDNLRVAFSEGNLPRVLASAFLPLFFYMLLDFIDHPHQKIRLAGIAAIFFLFVFCHPMMAAIFTVFATLLILLFWLAAITDRQSATLVIASIALGIGTTGWWLLPSLTGGITELNPVSVTQGLPVSSLSILLNPALRLQNPEADYVGLTLVIFCIAALFSKSTRDRKTVIFTSIGLSGILAYTPVLNGLYNALPGHSLLWPSRFQGISTFLLLLACMWVVNKLLGTRFRLAAAIPILLLLVDMGASCRLIGLRPPSEDIVAITTDMGTRPGWRVATLDKSRLGSQVPYFIEINSRREQVYGWAYQGARTAPNVAGLNDAIDYGAYPFLLDRLNLFGVDDILLLNDSVPVEPIGPALLSSGFSTITAGPTLTYLHRDGSPRIVIADWKGLAIGKGSINYCFLFPQIIQGESIYVDDYSIEQLRRYRTIVLTGFSWHEKSTAETLIRAAAGEGINVVVDLTRAQQDPVAQIPQFLGVWGEPIVLDLGPVTVTRGGRQATLSGFGKPGALWHTFTPQGTSEVEVTFYYLGQPATAIGSSDLAGHKIWFLGLNLIYHAIETKDPVALDLLANVLQIESETANNYRFIDLDSYTSGPDGYEFMVQLEQPADLLLPIARFDGTRVQVDGRTVTIQSLENLLLFAAPAGKHHVKIEFVPTTMYSTGLAITIASGVFLIIGIFLVMKASKERIRHEEPDLAQRLAARN